MNLIGERHELYLTNFHTIGNVFFDEVFFNDTLYTFYFANFTFGNNNYRNTCFSSTSCTSRTMRIGFNFIWQLVVYNVCYVVYINTTSSYIGSHQHLYLVFSE